MKLFILKHKKKLIFIGLSLVLLTSFFFWRTGKDKKEQFLTETVKRGRISSTVSVTGETIAETEIRLDFETGGRIKEISAFVGKEVAEGEIIASIDDSVLGQQVEKARLALEKAIAEAGANDDAIREAERAVKNAKRSLEETQNLEKQKVSAAEQELENAKDYYEKALEYYNKKVEESGADSSEAKYAQLTLISASNSKKTAEENLKTVKRARDLNEQTAQNNLDLAEEKLKTAQSDFSKRSRDALVENARVDYEIALTNLGKTILKAPVNGVITQINYKRGEVLGSLDIAEGKSGSFGKMLSKDLLLQADIPESDIAKIKLGQTAKVTFDALDSGEFFEAKVVEIEPAATIIQGVVYYRTKLKLDSVDPRIKPGMSADVDIQISQKDSVLLVPSVAVKQENGKNWVEILKEDGKTVLVEIKTGIKGDEGLVEVVSGDLKEGDEIVVLKEGADSQ